MSVTKAYTLYAAQIQTTGAVDHLIDNLVSQRISSGLRQILLGTGDAARPRLLVNQQQTPEVEFTTRKITSLSTVGVTGLKIDSDVDDDGLELWFQKRDEGANLASGSSHLKGTINEGILVPVSLRAGNDDVATIDYRCVITYDGTNDPIVWADSSAVEGSPASDEVFFAGPCSFNGTTIEGVQSITADFGLDVAALGGEGEQFTTFASVRRIQPRVTVNTLDVSTWASLGISGVAQTATDSLIYLRKGDTDGGRKSNATAEHVQFSMDDGAIYVQDGDATEDGDATVNIVFQPIYDGTNENLVVDTAIAIT